MGLEDLKHNFLTGTPTGATETATPPVSVNFTALPTRLKSTWRIRPGSPRAETGVPGAM